MLAKKLWKHAPERIEPLELLADIYQKQGNISMQEATYEKNFTA